MNEPTAEKLLQRTHTSYTKIAQSFSDTRMRVWSDCTAFEHLVKKGMTVLDVGCGNGKLAPWLLQKGVRYIGIDRNPYFVRSAQERYGKKNCEFFEGDLLALDDHPALKKKKFDLVFCLAVLHHLPSESMRVRALRQLRGRLSEDGALCMTNWNLFQTRQKSKSVWKQLFTKKEAVEYGGLSWRDILTRWKGGAHDEVLYYYAFTPSELFRLCRSAGFTTVRCLYTGNGKNLHWWNGRNICTIAHNSSRCTL